jgi:hypothetical protein
MASKFYEYEKLNYLTLNCWYKDMYNQLIQVSFSIFNSFLKISYKKNKVRF